MNRREFLQLSILSPFAISLPKFSNESEGLVFPIAFAENDERQQHNAVEISSFKKLNLWQLITQFIK